MRVGVSVTTAELPPATSNPFNTASAFMVGFGDNGPVGTAVKCQSVSDVSNTIGVRSATNQTLWDAADVYFREGGSVLYLSRVVGPAPVNASLTLQDSIPHPTVTVTAKYPGIFGNGLYVVVTNTGGNYTVLIQDASGNVLETHGPFAQAGGNAPLLADTTSSLVTFTQATGTGNTTAYPAALTATALTGGVDDHGNATLSNWQSALAAFTLDLGPGQVSAPAKTNTGLSGIWSALGTHAEANNRVAICDMDDSQTAATLVTDVASITTSGVASYIGFWASSCKVPGVTSGTTRTVPASCVISALCARADAAGNPNTAAAGDGFPLRYVTAFTTTYAQADIDTLNAAGINVFNTVFGVRENYGFVSAIPQATDAIFWQFSHSRFRMALVADFQVISHPFLFSQIDGKGLDIAAFSGAFAAKLAYYANPSVGAIYVQAPNGTVDQGFAIDTGNTVNTPTTIAAGQLNANISVRMSPFAQLVNIQLNSVPVNQGL